jgi:hypothetical protein
VGDEVRDFCDEILSFIGAESLTNEEFETIESSSLTLTLELYNELKAILMSRDAVSGTHNRLYFYFMAAGVQVSAPDLASSNIFIGAGLAN